MSLVPPCISLNIYTKHLTSSIIFFYSINIQHMFVGECEFVYRSIAVAVPSKAFVCFRLIRGFAESNPTTGMDVRLLCLWCVL
jgi:hypothetical protein